MIPNGFWSRPLSWASLWVLLAVSSLFLRPTMPVDETRYIGVAWEMWRDHSFLVPHLEGEPYSQKPPLLFWLMHLGWSVFGVNEFWPRLIPTLFGLAGLLLVQRIQRLIWPGPDGERQARLLPWLLLGGLFWAAFSTVIMFDLLLTFDALLGITGLLTAWRSTTTRRFLFGFLLLGLAFGLGGVTKGPVILVHLLPFALLAPLWGPGLSAKPRGWPAWYGATFAALLLGVAIGLSWALPAAHAGGEDYRNAIFVKQSAGRVVQSFAHRQPFYHYLLLLPFLFVPWTLWPRFWGSLGFRKSRKSGYGFRTVFRDPGVRFCLWWAVPVFLIFSAISGKQPQYLLPIFPALAAIIARLLLTQQDRRPSTAAPQTLLLPGLLTILLTLGVLGVVLFARFSSGDHGLPPWVGTLNPWWLLAPVVLVVVLLRSAKPASVLDQAVALASLTIVFLLALLATLSPQLHSAYRVSAISAKVHQWDAEGRPVAMSKSYSGQFQFLRQPTPLMASLGREEEARAWFAENPNGVFLVVSKESEFEAEPLFITPYRGGYFVAWDSAHFDLSKKH